MRLLPPPTIVKVTFGLFKCYMLLWYEISNTPLGQYRHCLRSAMFKFTPLALILSRSKDDDMVPIEVSLGADRSNGPAEMLVIPLPPKWSGVTARCADLVRLIAAATGTDPANLAVLKDESVVLPLEEVISKRSSYRVIRLESYPSAKKAPFFHCAVVAFQAASHLFLSANTSATGLSVSRFNLDPSCVFAIFGSPSDGCIVQSYSTARYLHLMPRSSKTLLHGAPRYVLGLDSRASVLKFSLATGEVSASVSGDMYTISASDNMICLLKGFLVTSNTSSDSAVAAPASSISAKLGKMASKSQRLRGITDAAMEIDLSRSMSPFQFTHMLPTKFNLLLSTSKDIAWFYTNSRVRFRVDNPEAYVFLHDFPVRDSTSSNSVSDLSRGCDVRRILKGSDFTSVKLVIIDESNYSVAFQYRNLMLTWCIEPASGLPIAYWSDGNPHSPHNNNAFQFEFVRDAGCTKVKIYICDNNTGSSYVLTVRSAPDIGGKSNSSLASFVSSKTSSGTILSVAGSEAYADFDLTSVLVPGTVVSLKVVVERGEHKGSNMMLTHRGSDVFCDDRFVV